MAADLTMNTDSLFQTKRPKIRLSCSPAIADSLSKKYRRIIKQRTGKTIEVMVYGDGAFKILSAR
jgi:hypothetical protein